MAKRVLFICTGNIDRSPTAEALLKDREEFEVRSAGTWMKAQKRVSKSLIDWSDVIFVMEERHKKAILSIKPEVEEKTVVLNIPNLYLRNDPNLIKILKIKLSKYLRIEL